MNDLLTKGTTIADIHRKFPKYDYWEIYYEVNDYSFLGKKRMITNRINKIAKSKKPSERRELSTKGSRKNNLTINGAISLILAIMFV